ncbi:MAG: hypothetical protein WCK88_05035 [bacterium]
MDAGTVLFEVPGGKSVFLGGASVVFPARTSVSLFILSKNIF